MPTMAFSAALSDAGTTSFVRVTAYPTAQARKDLSLRSIVGRKGPGPRGIRHDPRRYRAGDES